MLLVCACISSLTSTQTIVDTLLEKREMLEEYFSLTISEDGLVQRLPLLLSGYTPNLDKLPLFLMRLGPQVRSFRAVMTKLSELCHR